MTSFVMRAALPAAQEVVERTEHIKLSERDTLLVLDLLENPPPPNAKLKAAIRAWAENQKKLEEMQNDSDTPLTLVLPLSAIEMYLPGE